MPYILSTQRAAIENSLLGDRLERLGALLRAETSFELKGAQCRDALAMLIDLCFGEPCFEHSVIMARNIGGSLADDIRDLAQAIVSLHASEGGREGLLNYTITRLLNETYPSPRYKDFNQIAGVLSSLIRLAHPGRIELLGMLDCCKAEYYRKYAAPYEDQKEEQNGPVKKPQAPPPSSY